MQLSEVQLTVAFGIRETWLLSLSQLFTNCDILVKLLKCCLSSLTCQMEFQSLLINNI